MKISNYLKSDDCKGSTSIKKLLCVLLLASFMHVSATGFSQTIRVSLKANSLEQLFAEIEKQTEVKFLYRNENIVGKKVNINAYNTPLDVVLNEALLSNDLSYTEMDNNLIVVASNVKSQDIRITGTVTEGGSPLPGVNVSVKGTQTGAITDSNGNYSISAPNRDAVLIFTYIGYNTQEITIGNRTQINITMVEDTKVLEEVVVIGYGTRAKKDLTGAISQISSEEITRKVAMSPEFAMQGTMAGVYVSNPGSSPTARPEIRIRGVTTLGFNDPLYVIDGIPITEGLASSNLAREIDMRGTINIFTMINPNDIESISVLKDASATAIYGVRASNGVILITTKRGQEGKPRVNLTANYGIQNIFRKYDVMSQKEFMDLNMEAINNNKNYNKDWWYVLIDPSNPEYMGNKPNHAKDWLDAGVEKNAAIQDYNLSVTGGTKMSNYALGVGYSNQKNVIWWSNFERYSFFANSDHKLTKWLKVGESFRMVQTRSNGAPESANFNSISFVIPYQPLYDSSQSDGWARPGRMVKGYSDAKEEFKSYGYGMGTITNIFAINDHARNETVMKRYMGTFYAELEPIKGLRIKGTFSFDNYDRIGETYAEAVREVYSIGGGGTPRDGFGNSYGRSIAANENMVKEFFVGYNNKFGEHSIDLIGNAMSQKINWSMFSRDVDALNSPLTSWGQREINEGWSRDIKGGMYQRQFSGLIGYMSRLSYNYAQKYYLDATVRRDGSSKFGPGYKWGTFPSFAAVWRISSEKFMQDITWLNDLKIRGGWGQTGNQETESFSYLALMNLNPRQAFGSSDAGNGEGYAIYPATGYYNFPVKDMSWETVTTTSLGFDMIALKNKLSFTAEYYSRNTKGILQTIVLPWTLGAVRDPRINLATVSNKGVELQAGYNDRINDFGYHVSANLTTVANKVDNLYNGQRQVNNNNAVESGYTMNYWYGYKTAGIFQTPGEVGAWIGENKNEATGTTTYNNYHTGYMSQKAPGDVIYVDLNSQPRENVKELEQAGVRDHVIDTYDKTYLGKTIPGFYYGIQLGGDYKNWDISLSFRGVGDVMRYSSFGLESVGAGGRNYATEYRKRWIDANTSKTIPRAIVSDPSGNNIFSDRFLHRGAFLRFQQFQIGYNFRGELINRVGISNLRCFLAGSNIFVIAPWYPDLDPENVTTPTSFTLGVNVSF